MSSVPNERDLEATRAELDLVDRRLIDVLAERAALIDQVVHYKRVHDIPVVDRAREDLMLDRIEVQATSAGLDPRVARRVLRAVIDAFTLVEVEQLDEGAAPS